MPAKRKVETLIITLAAIVGLGVGAGAFVLTQETPAPDVEVYEPVAVSSPSGLVSKHRPAFELTDLNGQRRHVQEWDGKLLVINFWATWCAPCRHEIPFFIDLQDRYEEQGLQFVGIAIDQPDAVRQFVEEMGMNYPSLYGQLDALDVGKAYGNSVGALPYTVLVDRDGRIFATKNGAYERAEIEAVVTGAL